MALFSVSDLIIAATLVVNALALASTRLASDADHRPVDVESAESSLNPLWRLRILARRVRRYSCVIVFWNIMFFFLMFSVFPS